MAEEIVKLEVDTAPFSGLSIMGNLDKVQRMCDELADEYRRRVTIEDADTYRWAKAARARLRKAMKQVDDERKRVKTVYTAPLTTFECGVKSAVRSLDEAIRIQDEGIKAYEARLREAKRERLERYWEAEYPVYALCTGEAEEPLVPFSRIFDADWVKRMGEIGDDKPAQDAMDEVALTLASGEDVLERFDPSVRAAALSELYRTLDINAALDWAEQEARRQADIERVRAAQMPASGPAAAAEAAREPGTAPMPAEPVPSPQNASVPRWVVIIDCADAEEKDRAVAVMRGAGFHGRAKRVRTEG